MKQGRDKTRQAETKQGRQRQNKAGRDKTRQTETKQGRQRQNKADRDKTRQTRGQSKTDRKTKKDRAGGLYSYPSPLPQEGHVHLAVHVNVATRLDLHGAGGPHVHHGGVVGVGVHDPQLDRDVVHVSCTQHTTESAHSRR